MPTPPAAFSPFTTTKSGSCCSRSPGSSASRARRPGLPTTSPTKSSLTLADSFSALGTVARMQRPTAAAEPAAEPGSAAPVLEARDLVKRFGERDGAARGDARGQARRARRRHRPERRRARRRCCRFSPACSGPTRAPSRARRRRSAGFPSRPRSTGSSPSAENLRLFARLEGARRPEATVDRMLEQTGLRDRADDQVADPLGRQPPAREHRHRPARPSPRCCCSTSRARRSTRASATGSGSSSSRLAEEGTTVLYSTHVVQEAERYANTVVVLADGERLFSGSSARARADRRPRSTARRPTSRPPSSPSCASAGTEAHALAPRQGPADPAPLAAAGGDARAVPDPDRGARGLRGHERARASRAWRSSTRCPRRRTR